MPDLEDLERRVALLEDERAILRRLFAYGHAIDYGDEEAWASCFAENGVFDIRTRLEGTPNMKVSGRAELRAFVGRHTRAPERVELGLGGSQVAVMPPSGTSTVAVK